MKITDVRVLRMGAPAQNWNWLFVIIDTDEGIRGVGEGSLQYKDAGLTAEIEDFGRWLIGQDPFQIEYIWNALHRRVTWTGGAVTMSAISAIDLALYDIKGKALGVPAYDLIGGKVRDSVRAYANGWQPRERTPEAYSEAARVVVERGFTALKLYPFGGPQEAMPERIDFGLSLVRAVREAVGPKVEVAIDVRAALNMRGALRVARGLEPYNIAWLEEAILFDNADSFAELSRSVRVPLATGEQLYTRWEFRPLLERNLVQIIQPDICHAGGMTELKKLAAMAETYYITVAPHNSNGPISTVASLHLDMNTPNCPMQEIFVNFVERYNEVLTNPLVIDDQGYVHVPEGPGWGTDIDEDAVRSYPPNVYAPVRDGGYYQ